MFIKPGNQHMVQIASARLRATIIAATCLLCTLPVLAASDTKTETEKRTNNLFYSEILFHLYQQKYFATLTDLRVAEKKHPILYQGDDPELLLSGLAVSYGLYDLADQALQQLVSADKPQKTRDIAWFYTAKLRFLQGDLDAAEQALTNIQHSLPEAREGERLNLLVDVYRGRGQLDKARTVMDEFEGKTTWRYYALYNIGVSLVRVGKLDDGTALLKKVGRLRDEDEEIKSLADRANLALGYAYFAKGMGKEATSYFRQVRLEGPFSNQALLGLGWAHTVEENYQQALVPWFELKARHAINPTVQESLITIPHILERMKKPKLAVSHYKQAINTLEGALTSLDKIILKTRSGEFLRVLKPGVVDGESDWPWDLTALPDIDAGPYLTQLLQTREFQSAFEDYRTLIFLEYVLKDWHERLPAFMTSVKARADAFKNTSQRVAKQQFEKRNADIERQYAAIQEKLKRIENSKSAMALATVEESSTLKKLDALEAQVKRGGAENSDVLLQRIRALRGQITWSVTRDYAVRRWDLRETFDQLGESLAELHALRENLDSVEKTAPKSFNNYEPRFAQLNRRLEKLIPRIELVAAKQETRLQTLALNELVRRQRVLEQQIARARFSLVRLYDSISASQKPLAPAGGSPDSPAAETSPDAAPAPPEPPRDTTAPSQSLPQPPATQ